VLSLSAATILGCSSTPEPPHLLPESQRLRNVQQALNETFSRARSLYFLSYDGQWMGTDGDSAIELHADGTAVLTHYGQAGREEYRGQYTINTDSELEMSFRDSLPAYRAGKWPAMGVYRDHVSLLLAPQEDLRRGNDAAYWVFRHIRSDESPSPPVLLPDAPKVRPIALADGRLQAYVLDGKGGVASVMSKDRGRTWSQPQHEFDLPARLSLSLSLLDHSGESHLIFMHGRGEGQPAVTRFIDLWHCRSRDGRTRWEPPQRIWEGYCGAVLDVQEVRRDLIVVPFAAWKKPGEEIKPGTGSNYTTVVYSQDGGSTWRLSDSKLTAPCDPNFNGNNYGAIEPTILPLADGRIWMLLRTQAGSLYESFSEDGVNWSDARLSRFASSTSPAALVRLPDGALVLFWNNCEMPLKVDGAGVYGGRDALHGAISRDEGRTWRGFREVYRDPHRNDTPPKRGDRGTAYPVAVANADGSVHLVSGQGGRRTAIRVDPRWLEATQQSDDFSQGLDAWHTWRPFGPASGYWRDRTQGAVLAVHPNRREARVLQVRKPDDNSPDCAIWNFPAGGAGKLTLRLRLNNGFAGATISLADRFFDPDDERGQTQAAFKLSISPEGGLDENVSLAVGEWHTLVLAWSLPLRECRVTRDDEILTTLPLVAPAANGLSYLRLRSAARSTDRAGLFVESVEVEVSRP
jgi:hypothetical protein